MKHLIIALFWLLTTYSSVDASSSIALGYLYNPHVDLELWNEVYPYFLPDDHPIKAEMDRIFLNNKRRVTRNKDTLKKAKFKIVRKGKSRKPFIVAHPSFKGYLLKLYLDRQRRVSDGKRFIERIQGSEVTREVIDRFGYQPIFKVPKKWIYPMPTEPSPPDRSKYARKNFVLVVEDMNILNQKENEAKWRSVEITPPLLDAVYLLLDEAGLSDSVFAFNIPFSHDGKIAIVDTEYFHRWPIRFGPLKRYLSPEMQKYWKFLIKSK